MSHTLSRSEFVRFFDETVSVLGKFPSSKVLGFYIDPIHGFFCACLNDEECSTCNCPDFTNFDVTRIEKEDWADSYYECEGELEIGDFEGNISMFDPMDGDENIKEHFYSFLKPEIGKLIDRLKDNIPSNIKVVGIQMLDSEVNDFWRIR
ncbi:MAG: hypothetical protein V2B20_27590 [Pseudomonadota bacterium]